MRCTTTSGRFRCDKELGPKGEPHEGECATAEAPRPTRFGPYTNVYDERAYIRGWLDGAAGAGLDTVGRAIGIERALEEDDCAYRARLWKEASR